MIVGEIRHRVVIDARVISRWRLLGGAVHQLIDRFAVQAGDLGQALAHECAQVGTGHLVDQRCREGGHVGLAFEGAWIGFFGQLLEK